MTETVTATAAQCGECEQTEASRAFFEQEAENTERARGIYASNVTRLLQQIEERRRIVAMVAADPEFWAGTPEADVRLASVEEIEAALKRVSASALRAWKGKDR